MKRKRYTEEQIVSILKEHEAGSSVPDLSRRHGVAENTIYRWKSKYGGMRSPRSNGYVSWRSRTRS
jgi:putative transposase